MRNEPHDPVQKGNSDGVLDFTNQATMPPVALLLSEATASKNEHVQVRMLPIFDRTPRCKANMCTVQEPATYMEERITGNNLEHQDDTSATQPTDGTDTPFQYSSLSLVPDPLTTNQKPGIESSANIFNETPAFTGVAEAPIQCFDDALHDLISSPLSSSQEAYNLLAVQPFTSSESVAAPGASEIYNLLEELPSHLSFPKESLCAADEAEDCIIGTISDFPDRLFREQGHKRFFSGHTLADSVSQPTCSKQIETSSENDDIQTKGSTSSNNDTGLHAAF